MKQTEFEQFEKLHKQATDRAIKIHEALDIPHVIRQGDQVVEMLGGKVLKVIVGDAKKS